MIKKLFISEPLIIWCPEL